MLYLQVYRQFSYSLKIKFLKSLFRSVRSWPVDCEHISGCRYSPRGEKQQSEISLRS